MELSGPGVQYIADNQLYNSIITAHALLMSAPFHFEFGMLYNIATDTDNRIKGHPGGRVKLYGETQTPKRMLMVCIVTNLQVIGRQTYLR